MDIRLDKDQKVNKIVTNITEKLKEEIISLFHPKSIILFGSFGKGEISVYEKNGEIKFLSDCDVIIVPYRLTWLFNRKGLYKFEQDFYKRTGLKVDIRGATLTFVFSFPFLIKWMIPTIAIYDLKYASKVIHGKNYLERIPNFHPKDIPLWEGIKLLLNRAAESLIYFSPKNPNENMTFWTDKIVLACQDALLISKGIYNSSLIIRNKMFKKMFPSFIDEIGRECSDLLMLATDATNRRIKRVKYSGDPIRYWFEARRIWDKTFRYIVKNDLRMEFKDYVEFQEKYIKNERIKEYQFEILSSAIYQNVVSMLKIASLKDIKLLIKIVCQKLSFTFWRHIIHSLIPLIYFGISEEYEVNKWYLNRVRNILSKFKELKETSCIVEEYEYLKNEVLHIWYHLR